MEDSIPERLVERITVDLSGDPVEVIARCDRSFGCPGFEAFVEPMIVSMGTPLMNSQDKTRWRVYSLQILMFISKGSPSAREVIFLAFVAATAKDSSDARCWRKSATALENAVVPKAPIASRNAPSTRMLAD
jgi:hypothetical protein